MAPALLASAPNRPNVPAWKRLGLKLKSAQQSSRPYEAPMHVAPRVAKPKRVKREREAEDGEAPRHKKLRKSAEVHEPPANTTSTRSPAQSPIASSPKRRKSVTFTPETKTEDGDSVRQLYNGWVAKHLGHVPNLHNSLATLAVPNPSEASTVNDSTVNEVLRQVEGAEKSIRRNKPKREKRKPQSSKNSKKAPKPVADFGPALSYLKQFHESKDTWKFNKIHQINLIKNAFDIDKIPSDYIGLFYIYIKGLKGDARRQLRDAAIATMVKDREEAEEASESLDDVAKKDEFEVTLRNNMKTLGGLEGAEKNGYEERVLSDLSDLTMKKRMAKRMRAEEILDELAQEVLESTEGVNSSSKSLKDSDGDDDTQKRIKLSDGSIKKLRRKRKQRTSAVDDDSSSSESSSSESSSEDEQEVVQEAADEGTSSSSSSSSSTSSEGSEEVDESESESFGSETGSDESES